MSFAGHQSFHLRDGWLRKGMRAIRHDPSTFTRPDAPDTLGLGSVMVDALRFWMEATGVAYGAIDNRWRVLKLTPFGTLVYQHDPYFEDEATLWLLHYHLASDKDRATTWYWFFNHYARATFTKAQAVDALESWAITNVEKAPARKTLERDVEVLLHTYVPSGRDQTPEDTLDCPLSALNLIGHQSRESLYHLNRPAQNRLLPQLVLYVLLRYQEQNELGSREISLSDALARPGSPGRVFSLSATALTDVLVVLREDDPALAVRMARTAGLDIMTLPDVRSDDLLERLYLPRQTGVYA